MKKKINAKIALKDVVVDEDLYPRNNYCWQTAYDYSESMKTGAQFPKIVVAKYNNVYLLVDGKHRLEAQRVLLGRKKFNETSVPMEILLGLNKREIYGEAIRRNMTHGRQFSVQEKVRIAVRLKDLKYTTKEISRTVQISPGKLQTLIGKKLVSTTSGEEIVLKKTFENSNVKDVEYLQQKSKGYSQEYLLGELITLLESGALNLKSNKIVLKLAVLKRLLSKVKIK